MVEVANSEALRSVEKSIETVTVVAIKDGNILTVRHNAGTTAGEGVTGFPGGRKDEGETEREAAAREFHEETGLEVKAEELEEFPGNFFEADLDFNGSGKKHATMRVFIARTFTGNLTENSLETRPEWVPLGRINRGLYETSPNVLEAIKNAQEFLEKQ